MLPSLRGQLTPREGAGQLPALLLDQGQPPGTPPLPASKRAEQSPYNTAQEASSKGGGRSKGLAQDLSTPRNHGGGVVAVSSPPSQRERKEKAMIARFDHRTMLTALLALTTTLFVVVVVITLSTLLIRSAPAAPSSRVTDGGNLGAAPANYQFQ